jgi:hypothetical protein
MNCPSHLVDLITRTIFGGGDVSGMFGEEKCIQDFADEN